MNFINRTVNNRYRILEHLATGGMSDLYQATDQQTDGIVAVKVLRQKTISGRAEDIIRFHTILEKISNLNYPGIVKILDFGLSDATEPHHFVVMELIESQNLQDLFGEGKSFSVEESVEIATQICRALEMVHTEGIVHGDLKPGNVLCQFPGGSATVPEPAEVKLIDFGLSRMRDIGSGTDIEYVTGTFRYLSPEQAGIIRHPVDERSDLYSLGIIFYQLLTRELPFRGQSLIELFHQQAATVPEPPSQYNKQIPEMLDAIILKLLEKEPELRYRSAKGLINDLELIQQGKKKFELGKGDTTLRLDFVTAMIGRTKELGTLNDALVNLDKEGRLIFITGEAGIGKSRLADEFRKEVLKTGIPYIEGKAFDRENKFPFQPIRDALTDYVAQFRRYPDDRKKVIRDSVLKECYDLGQIIIDFNGYAREILGECPEIVPLEPEREMQRFYLVITRFIEALAKAEQGLVMMFEDLHWSDEGTLHLIKDLCKGMQDVPLIMVGAYRDTEVPDDHPIWEIGRDESSLTLPVNRFTLEEMVSFVRALLFMDGDDAAFCSSELVKRSNGNPFFAIEILKQLVDSSAVKQEQEEWRLNRQKLVAIDFPENVIDAILRGTEDLTDEERLVLTRASVIGKVFALDVLADFRDAGKGKRMQAMEDILASLERAVTKGIITEDVIEPGRYSFVHDRVRDAFYSVIKEKKRKALHLQVGLILEEKHKENVEPVIFDLAGNFIEAGDVEKIVSYAYRAGIRAKENYAYKEALHYYATVKAVIERSENLSKNEKMHNIWVDCMESLGVINVFAGNSDEALHYLNDLLPYIDDDMKKSNLYQYMSRAMFRKGEFTECETYAKIGLKMLGEWLPTKKPAVIFSSIKELFSFFIFRMIPIKKQKRNIEKHKMIIWFYDWLNWVYFFSEGYKLFRLVFRMFSIAERKIGYSKELVFAYYYFSFSCMISGLMNTGYSYIKKATDIAYQLGDTICISRLLNSRAFYWAFNKDLEKSIHYSKEEINLLEKIGDCIEINIATHLVTSIYTYISDYKNANYYHSKTKSYMNDIFEELMNSGGDYPSICYIETGKYEEAEIFLTDLITKAKKVQTGFILYLLQTFLGYLYTETGRIDEALQMFDEAYSIEKREMLPPHYRMLHNFYSPALIMDYKNRENLFDNRDKNKYLNKIKRFSKLSITFTKKWGNYYGTALRINGMYQNLIRNNKKAEEFLNKGIEWSRNIGRRYEHARTLYEYGLFLREQNREPEAWQKLTESYRIFDEIGAPPYKEKIAALLGLDAKAEKDAALAELVKKEKLARVQEFTRELDSINERGALINTVLSRVMELTGARSAYLFLSEEIDDRPRFITSRHLDDNKQDEYSSNIVQKVFDTSEPVLTTNAELEKEFAEYKSVSLYGLKSVIAIPVKYHDLVNGVLYLDNDLAAGVFSEDHIELLKDFLSHGALTIENMLLREKLKESEKEKRKKKPKDPNLEAAIAYLKKHCTEDITREDLADDLAMSPDYLGKLFKTGTGKTIREYLNELRVKRAAEMLGDKEKSITDIAFEVGFESLSTFYRLFYRVMGMTPTEMRDRE